MVYERVFPPRETTVWLFPFDLIACRKRRPVAVPPTSILSTCRAICHEATPVLHRGHRFVLPITPNSAHDNGYLVKILTDAGSEWQVVPTKAIRFLTLRIELDYAFLPSWQLQQDCLHRVVTKVKIATSLNRLHIIIGCHSEYVQSSADKVMRILGEIECSAHVTGRLLPSIRSIDIDSSSYFSMLGKLEGCVQSLIRFILNRS